MKQPTDIEALARRVEALENREHESRDALQRFANLLIEKFTAALTTATGFPHQLSDFEVRAQDDDGATEH